MAPRLRAARLSMIIVGIIGLLLQMTAIGSAGARRPNAGPPPNVAVSPDLPQAYQQPSIARDPTRPRHLAIAYQERAELKNCFIAVSSNNGRTWETRALFGPDGEFPMPPPPPPGTSAFRRCVNPVVAYDPSGNLYYALQAGEPGAVVLVTVSRDGGASFEEPITLDSSSPDVNDWYPSIAVDSKTGKVYVAFERYARAPAFYAYSHVRVSSSDDKGKTFSASVIASDPARASHATGPVATVGPDGVLYVAFFDWKTFVVPSNGQGSLELFVAVSSDGAKTFTRKLITRFPSGCSSDLSGCDSLHYNGWSRLHSIVAPSPKQAFLVWWGVDAEGKNRVSFASSSDGGASWTEPKLLPVSEALVAGQQHHPWLSAAPSGRIDLAYYSMSSDEQHTVHLSSTDDLGKTFAASRQLSSVPSDAYVGPPGQYAKGANFGDFVAVTSAPRAAFVAWTDARRGNRDNGKQDVFFAKVARAR